MFDVGQGYTLSATVIQNNTGESKITIAFDNQLEITRKSFMGIKAQTKRPFDDLGAPENSKTTGSTTRASVFLLGPAVLRIKKKIDFRASRIVKAAADCVVIQAKKKELD